MNELLTTNIFYIVKYIHYLNCISLFNLPILYEWFHGIAISIVTLKIKYRP